jgi:hypothetical protein
MARSDFCGLLPLTLGAVSARSAMIYVEESSMRSLALCFAVGGLPTL